MSTVCDICGTTGSNENPVGHYAWDADIRDHGGSTGGEAHMCRECAFEDLADYDWWSQDYDERYANAPSVHV